MAPPSHLLVPDSSVKALIAQCQSSSSPSSSVNSPITESSLPLSSSNHGAHASNPRIDLTLPSSSSSSFSLVPEILAIPEHEGPRLRRKEKQNCSNGKHKHDENVDPATQERSKHVKLPHRGHVDRSKKTKGCHENLCCKCMAGFTADCAAVCCCPLALLHLAALTFIRLPTAVAWKMVVNLKNRIYTKKRPPKNCDNNSPRSNFSNPWSYASSPEGLRTVDMGTHMAKFDVDSQDLWQHFEARRLDFGGLSMRRDPQ